MIIALGILMVNLNMVVIVPGETIRLELPNREFVEMVHILDDAKLKCNMHSIRVVEISPKTAGSCFVDLYGRNSRIRFLIFVTGK